MENTTLIKRVLWANVAFAELCAIAAIFLSGKWSAMDEMTAGYGMVFGIELLLFSCLLMYAATRKILSRVLIRAIIALNGLLLIYFLVRLFSASSLSMLGMEMLIVDSVIVAAITFVLAKSIHAQDKQQRSLLAS